MIPRALASAGRRGDGSTARRALVVFARAPEHGRVKTRLAAELGADTALAVYRELAERVIAAVQSSDAYSLTIAYTPAGSEESMRAWLGPFVTLREQHEGDLGMRMAAAIGHALSVGAERVVVIGTDCPEVTAATVEDAFLRLESSDVVVGPTRDGGYYLIGMSRLHAALFEAIPWSSAETMRVTLDRARADRLSVTLLDELVDVDTADDWQAWHASRGHRPP